jgi:hypothetical protein
MVNAALLHATVRHIRAHPDTWFQMDYRRGHAGCVAYHAAILAGAQLAHVAPSIEQPSGGRPWPNHDPYLVCNRAARDLDFTRNDEIHLAEFARRALGLNAQSARALFDATNTLADLERLVESYTAPSNAPGRGLGPRSAPGTARPTTGPAAGDSHG